MKFNFLRSSLTGEFELGRVMLAASGFLGMTTPIVFQVLDMYHNGWHFDVTPWCLAYDGGLAALGSIGVFAIGKKEKDVAAAAATQAATAQQVQDTEQSK